MRQNPDVLVHGLGEFKEREVACLGYNGDVDVPLLFGHHGIEMLQTSSGQIDGDSDDSDYEHLTALARPSFLPITLEGYKLPPLQDTVYQACRSGCK